MTLGVITVKQFGDRRWQIRELVPVDKLLAIEKIGDDLSRSNSGIQNAFKYWQERKRKGRVRTDDFKLGPMESATTLLIDVTPENPYNYKFLVKRDLCFKWLQDRRLAEFPYSDIIRWCSTEYHSCKSSAEPVGYHISHDLNGFKRDYLRLLLPLTDQSGHVSALACVSRHLDSPILAGLPPSTLPG